MSLRFGKATYRPPRHNYYTRTRTRYNQQATGRAVLPSKALLADTEASVRDAIDEGMQACYTQLGTHHPPTTYYYTSPIYDATITITRTRAGTQYATMATYAGPLGHWYCYIGWGQGTLFCAQPATPP